MAKAEKKVKDKLYHVVYGFKRFVSKEALVVASSKKDFRNTNNGMNPVLSIKRVKVEKKLLNLIIKQLKNEHQTNGKLEHQEGHSNREASVTT